MKPPSPAMPPRAPRRRAFAAAALLAAVATLASCSLSRPSPAKRTFLLDPALPSASAAAPKPTSVRVGVVNVAAPFRGKAFVYRDSELKYDADYYDEFFVAPAVMLSEATAKALVGANVFRRVVPFGAAADDGDYVLDGFVSELYGDARNPAAPVAVVTAAFYLSPTNVAGPGVIWSREYRQRVAASGTSPEAMARAWNTALSAVLADLARDLAAAELPK
jgi:cholesterol transport system auxiliary component